MDTTDIDLYDIDATNIADSLRLEQMDRNAFVLCTAGSVTLDMDTRRYTLHPGDIYLYSAFAQTTVADYTPNVQAVYGAADFEVVLKALEAFSDSQHIIQIRMQPQLSLSAEQFERINRMVGLVRTRRNEPSLFAGHIVMAMTHVLLYEIMDAYMTNIPAGNVSMSRSDTVFMRFLAMLSQHFRKEREVSFYAGELGLTPRYFATIIREKSGLSPGGWIARFVIAEAKTQLLNPDVSVKEVSNMLNFPNQSFFGRYFRQNTGLTPGEYRKGRNP